MNEGEEKAKLFFPLNSLEPFKEETFLLRLLQLPPYLKLQRK